MSSVRIDIERRHTAASAMRELDEMGGVKRDHQAGSSTRISRFRTSTISITRDRATVLYWSLHTKFECKGAYDQRGNEGMRKQGSDHGRS
jgi:hypothetical protein